MKVDLNNLSLKDGKLFNDVSIEIKEDYHNLIEDLY